MIPIMGIRDENGIIVPDNSPRSPIAPAAEVNKGKYPWYNIQKDALEWLKPAKYIVKIVAENVAMKAGIARRDQDIVELGRLFDLANIQNMTVIEPINEILRRTLIVGR